MTADVEMKYLRIKSDWKFNRTLAKLDKLDNQIVFCTKLMIIFCILSVVNMFLAITFGSYLILTR